MTAPGDPAPGVIESETGGGTYIESRIYYPAGADPDERDAWLFALRVVYRGERTWSVGQGDHIFYTHTGKMLYLPSKMTQERWCRFDFETACRIARTQVETTSVNGVTWREYVAAREARRAAQEAVASQPSGS